MSDGQIENEELPIKITVLPLQGSQLMAEKSEKLSVTVDELF